MSEIISGEAKHKAVHEGLCYSSAKWQIQSSVDDSFNFDLLNLLLL